MPTRFGKLFHWPLFAATLLLLTVGLVNLYSAATATDDNFFYSQLIWAGVGLVVAAAVYVVDYRVYERLAYPFFLIVLLMLVGVLFSRAIAGSHRWLMLGPVRLQPSELMKVAMLLALSKYFHDQTTPAPGFGLWQLRWVWVMLGLGAGLIIVEPDLGTGLLVLALGGTMILFARLRLRAIILLIVMALITIPIAWEFVLKDYQKNRVMTLIEPDSDPRGRGYHRRQSVIAVGSGQLTGKGFQNGTQSQLRFLPEQHTDFIFSVYAEEEGFAGAALLLTLYLTLILSGLHIASKAREKFGVLATIGATSIIFWQAFINIGMVTGTLPVVGVTLPFMSYGGTSLLVTLSLVGLMLNIYSRRNLF